MNTKRNWLWLVMICSASAVFCSSASTKEIFVATNGSDSNAGTQSSPKASLRGASYIAASGDTISLRGGAYRWGVNQGVNCSGVLIRSYPNEWAVIDGTGVSYQAVTIYGSNNTIQSLEIKNSSGNGLVIDKASNVTVKWCRIHNNQDHGIYARADQWEQNYNTVIDGNTLYRNCLRNTSTGNGAWPSGIGVTLCHNATVKYNTVYETKGEGIRMSLTRGGSMFANTIRDCFSIGAYLDHATDVSLYGNFIYSTGNTAYYRNGVPMMGIQIGNEPYAFSNSTARCKIYNNVVVNTASGFKYYHRNGTGWINCLVANNTFYKSAYALVSLDNGGSAVSGNEFTNNIVLQTGSVSRFGGSSSGVWFNRNSWFGGNGGGIGGSGDGTLYSDPRLVNPASTSYSAANYKLQSSSPCINAAKSLTSHFTTDYERLDRGSPWEMGAFRF
jgi:hypothetical protein